MANQHGYVEGPDADDGLAAAALVALAGGAAVAEEVDVAFTLPAPR